MSKILCVSLLIFSCLVRAEFLQKKHELKVFTLNTWHNGEAVQNGQQLLNQVLEYYAADVILLQESQKVKTWLDPKLKYHIVSNGLSMSIASRTPPIDQIGFQNSIGMKTKIDGKTWVFVSVHLSPDEYAPYLACFKSQTNEEIITIEKQLRTFPLQNEFKEMEKKFGKVDYFILGGDFNSPSHLDWSPRNKSRNCNRSILFPTSFFLESIGFVDSFRKIYKDPVRFPGYTWSTVEKFNSEFKKPEPQDRIDMILFRGNLISKESKAVRTFSKYRDTDKKWPSDHEGVLTRFHFPKTSL